MSDPTKPLEPHPLMDALLDAQERMRRATGVGQINILPMPSWQRSNFYEAWVKLMRENGSDFKFQGLDDLKPSTVAVRTTWVDRELQHTEISADEFYKPRREPMQYRPKAW